jgi:nucleoside-diphosphate-sugar epimerase
MTAGKQARDWIFLDDIVQALQMALDKPLPPGTSIDLGTGHATSVAEVVETIYRLANSSGRPLIGAIPSRPGEDPIQTADANATQALIGWRAETSLEQGLRQLLEQ